MNYNEIESVINSDNRPFRYIPVENASKLFQQFVEEFAPDTCVLPESEFDFPGEAEFEIAGMRAVLSVTRYDCGTRNLDDGKVLKMSRLHFLVDYPENRCNLPALMTFTSMLNDITVLVAQLQTLFRSCFGEIVER